jgi:hypothetical protein
VIHNATDSVENSLNSSEVESENETGLARDIGKNVPRMDNADDENVISAVCENTHKPKITYADIVKSKGEEDK